jgi:hypothetical protein
MWKGLTIATCAVLATGIRAQGVREGAPPGRYGIEARLKKYPQGTPKEALASVLAAIEENNFSYLLAHLADPEFVDKRVKEVHRGQFDELVKEISAKIIDSPASVKQLEQFLKAGDWEDKGNTAVAKLKDLKDQQVFFRKIGNRWFMENRQKEEK